MPSTSESWAEPQSQSDRRTLISVVARLGLARGSLHSPLADHPMQGDDAEEEEEQDRDQEQEHGRNYDNLGHEGFLDNSDSEELDDILTDEDERLSGDDEDQYLAQFWPGLLSTQPLNPPAPLLPTASTSLYPFPSHSPSDPSSSTSPTSFLSPGVIFTGSQLFVPISRRSPSGFPASRAPPRRDPHFTELASALSQLPPRTYASATHRTHPLFSAAGAEAEVRWRREAEFGLEGMSSGERRRVLAEETRELRDVRNAMERLAGRAAGWRDEDAMMEAAMEAGSMLEDNAPVEEDEHWGVQVVIHSYSHQTQTISGLMHALCVPDASAQIVTTYFQGDILNPAVDGLFARKVGAKKCDDSLYWAQLGPFKGLGREELSARSGDVEWLRQKTEGWMLMSWQELDFINVTPAESTLSIAGHYLICMDRQTGKLEGLYVDPVSSPYQRLVLTPTTSSAPFSLGTFDFR